MQLYINLLISNILNDMPVIYLLVIIITALVIWLIVENIKSRNSIIWDHSKATNINTKALDSFPMPSLYYDFSYQLVGMNKAAIQYFKKNNTLEKLETQTLDNAFDNKNLLHHLDEILVHEKTQQFELSLIHEDKKDHFLTSMIIAGGDKNNAKLIVLFLQEISSFKNQIYELNEKRIEQQTQYSKLISKKNESEAQKADLEKAFKHSSKHHIQLQKALLENEKQRKQLQDAVEVINKQKEELKRANEEIVHHARMKEIFFANTSHEIRTPLNAIIGFTNLLIQMKPTDTQLNYLKNIKTSGDNLLIVLNDILDFSKIEAGKMTFEQISFLITEQIEHLFSTMRVKADEKNIKLQQNIDPSIPEVLIGDPTRLNQILINLIGNAIKFSNTNGIIELILSERKRTNTHVHIKFEVKDDGIGISKDKISTIFNSFTQAENETTRKYGGTGLGLSIVKQLVELQNGEIFVKSNLNQGSTFTFYLSFAIGHFSSIRKTTNIEEDHLADAQNIWLLIAEDNQINQQLAVDTIKNWKPNINIDIAKNGKEAIAKIEKNNYHIVFMDIQMPEMDGIEATRHIRTQLAMDKRHIPIIAMTAHALKNEKDHFIEVGMNDYISKPFAPEILIRKIAFYSQKSIQDSVKNGKPFNTNQHSPEMEESSIKAIRKTNTNQYQYLNLSYLEKIYNNDYVRIKKILQMYIDSVQNEIDDISNAYKSGDLRATQAKAHTLKPKMTYLGCTELFENSKNIEQTIKQNGNLNHLDNEIDNLKEKWPLIKTEILDFMNN